MVEYKDNNIAYNECVANGFIIHNEEIQMEKIKTNLALFLLLSGRGLPHPAGISSDN